MSMSLALTRPTRLRLRRADWAVAAGVLALAQLEVWLAADLEQRSAHALAALAMSVPLAYRRQAPLVVVVASLLPLYVMRLAGHEVESAYIMLVLLLAFSAVGLYCPRRRAIAGLAGGLVLLAGLLALESAMASGAEPAPGAGDFVFLASIVSVIWAFGVAVRERGSQAEALADRAEAAERDREARARAAVADERARIARELHDVVAHSISVIAVQVGTMRRRVGRGRAPTEAELQATEEVARQALSEMRRMLGLLRAEESAPSLAPQPGIDELPALVEQVRAAGLPVELDMPEPRLPLSPGVDLAAYRIVQEALTNVIKHAGRARARVTVRHGSHGLEVEVADDGRGPGTTAAGEGHGHVGMRERVALYGGSFHAGPGDQGGFVVRATLPVPTA